MENWFNGLKDERAFHQRYASREDAEADLFDYIDVLYNQQRRYSGLKAQISSKV